MSDTISGTFSLEGTGSTFKKVTFTFVLTSFIVVIVFTVAEVNGFWLLQAFSEGIDHAVLLKVKEGTSPASIDHMLQSFRALGKELSSAIVQLTAGLDSDSTLCGQSVSFNSILYGLARLNVQRCAYRSSWDF